MSKNNWWAKKEAKKSITLRQLDQQRGRGYMAGRLIWISAEIIDGKFLGEKFNDGELYKRLVQGTYIKAIHGPLPCRQAPLKSGRH